VCALGLERLTRGTDANEIICHSPLVSS
jgi:hypothetical protein